MPRSGCGNQPAPSLPAGISPDTDQDGIPDGEESAIGGELTPLYASSVGEQDPFATFQNEVPLTNASVSIGPFWFIAAYNEAIDAAFADGQLSDLEYALAIALGNDTFYGCLAERFSNQSAAYASSRTNVGNPAHPAPGNSFIDDNSSRALNLENKLTGQLF